MRRRAAACWGAGGASVHVHNVHVTPTWACPIYTIWRVQENRLRGGAVRHVDANCPPASPPPAPFKPPLPPAAPLVLPGCGREGVERANPKFNVIELRYRSALEVPSALILACRCLEQVNGPVGVTAGSVEMLR